MGYIPSYSFYNIANERYYTFINWDKKLSYSYKNEFFENAVEKFSELICNIYLIYTPDTLSSYDKIIANLLEKSRLKVVYDGDGKYTYLNSNQEYVKFVIYEVIKYTNISNKIYERKRLLISLFK